MTLASSARVNSQETNGRYKLVPAVSVELLETGYYSVNGACGHRLACVRRSAVAAWEQKIAAGRGHRKRCMYCLQEREQTFQEAMAAHRERLGS